MDCNVGCFRPGYQRPLVVWGWCYSDSSVVLSVVEQRLRAEPLAQVTVRRGPGTMRAGVYLHFEPFGIIENPSPGALGFNF